MFSKFRVSTKIILPIVIILTIANVVTNYITTHQMNTLAKNSAKESLEMLTNSIFITLRNAMNKGLTSLIVAKSEKTIEMYSPGSAYTNDKETLETFETKEEQVQEIFKNDSHYLRVLKPMIATQECLLCHANQQEGDVIGVIDVTFSLDEADATISETISEILMTSLAFIVFTILVVWIFTI